MHKHTSTHKTHNAITDHLDRYLATGEILLDKLNDALESDRVAESILAIGLIIACVVTALWVLTVI